MNDAPAKKVVLLKRKSDRIPAKADRKEEIKRISDLLLTLSKRVRQLESAPETTK